MSKAVFERLKSGLEEVGAMMLFARDYPIQDWRAVDQIVRNHYLLMAENHRRAVEGPPANSYD